MDTFLDYANVWFACVYSNYHLQCTTFHTLAHRICTGDYRQSDVQSCASVNLTV